MNNLIKKRRNLEDIQKEMIEKGELINTDVTETHSEHKFGQMLIDAGIKIKPQFIVGEYTFDLKVLRYPVLIEIDGSVHNKTTVRDKDNQKARYAMKQGFRVIRFSNREISQEQQSHLVREVKDILADCIKCPREVQLYPLGIFEQVKRWLKCIRKNKKKL